MEKTAFNFNKLFEAKPLNTEETAWTIVLGSKAATPIKYKTKREAIAAIHGRDWNLIASLIVAIHTMLHDEKQDASQNLVNVKNNEENKKEE